MLTGGNRGGIIIITVKVQGSWSKGTFFFHQKVQKSNSISNFISFYSIATSNNCHDFVYNFIIL